MKIIKFEDLEIWKLSLTITKNIYDLTSKKELCHDFELKNQIRRAIISASSNIVVVLKRTIIMNLLDT